MIAKHGSKSNYLTEDLIPRLELASARLKSQSNHPSTSLESYVRLQGKVQGVELALSYAREGLRG